MAQSATHTAAAFREGSDAELNKETATIADGGNRLNVEHELVSLHRNLLTVRVTEETLAARYREQEMRTPTHFGTGQEAVAVGVCQALRPDDVVFSHHRCHNHYVAKGGSIYELAAELYGRADGCSGGRGGSVHLTSPENGLIATSAILGEMTAVAVGAALSFKMDGLDRVAVTFFGEGAMDEGAFYEALNYASIKKLPVLFACENNLYATESPMSVRQAAGTELCDRVRAFKVEATTLDGNDVLEVYTAAKDAVAKLRAGDGPVFLEMMTYRWREHVGPNFDHELDRTYRSREEVEDWIENRDPVKLSGARLVDRGLASTDVLEDWRSRAQAEVDDAVERARNAPWPEVSTLFDLV
jgi:TPP-dependent pyruvate/acetoin dehydrogenase alpha subunit